MQKIIGTTFIACSVSEGRTLLRAMKKKEEYDGRNRCEYV
jgi:hypothetical protein